MLSVAFSESAWSRKYDKKWYKHFSECREDIERLVAPFTASRKTLKKLVSEIVGSLLGKF